MMNPASPTSVFSFFTVYFAVLGQSGETFPALIQGMFLEFENEGKQIFHGPDSGLSNPLQPQSFCLDIFIYCASALAFP